MARVRLVTLGIVALLAAACGGPGEASTIPSGTAAAATQGATVIPTEDTCATSLPTMTAGKLTVGTTNPA